MAQKKLFPTPEIWGFNVHSKKGFALKKLVMPM
jgi:hypothetical protein